jgi:multiple sugar transport system ATP-binding protein
MAFPLKSKKITDSEVDKKIKEMAEILQIGELLDRKPGFLSGGQRQRVALGRALIREADVYLLDEPISHLDAKLRHHMRGEIKAMCSERGATVVYVTHDYKEAMALSDRIVVLNKGKAMQIGTPDQVYHRPDSEFVGAFLGDPSMSFLDGILKEETGNYFLELNELHIPVSRATGDKINAVSKNGKVRIGVRASEVSLSKNPDQKHNVQTEVYVVETFGYHNIVTCQCKSAGLVQSFVPPNVKINIHETVFLDLSEKNIHLFVQDGEAILHPVDFKNGQVGVGNVIH